MKILDRYILTTFLFNFFSSFLILMLIFIFQAIWLFIDDVAGKGLDIVIIGKFLLYLTPELMDKVIPLTVLLSSILTFGSFAENYEFAAMKASGISLQRAMRSLIVFIVFLGGVTFYFANSVIPVSQQKFYNMRRNIAKLKPAAAIEEGVFSDFEDMNIKVDEKYGEKDRFLRNVIIHQKTRDNLNNRVIKAKSGELISSESSEVIQLVLRDGHYYEDVQTKKREDQRKQPFAEMDFDVYRMNIEVPEMDQDVEEDLNISTEKMKNVDRLTKDIDSLRTDNDRIVTSFSKNTIQRMGMFLPVTMPLDSLQIKKDSISTTESKTPEILGPGPSPAEVVSYFDDMQQVQIFATAQNNTANVLKTVQSKRQEMDRRYKIYNLHILSLHKKYALALSCVILFFVGAPLGAIIRKGGVGLPMVVAIILFLIYYFVGVFAGNYAKEGNISPILGAWLSTLIMLPLGVVLTQRATADKGLMTFGGLMDRIRDIFKRKDKKVEA